MDNHKKMTVTLFKVKGMDCPSEENIIRMKLAELGDDIASLDFDLRKRTLAVTHSESAVARLADAMESVDMGAKIIETRDADAADPEKGRCVCQSVDGNRTAPPLVISAGQLLQRPDPAQPGMGIRRCLC